MYYREIIEKLTLWSASPARKPLILRGARQVGKTSVVRMFAGQFDQFIELNLDLYDDLILFENKLSVADLFQAILLKKNLSRVPGRVLLFIDEIQNSPEAVALLRYFYEKMPDIHVIAAGSLLEVSLAAKKISFPVGRVEFLYLYPFSFAEYLRALEAKESLDILKATPIPDYACQALFEHFHRYTLIGGMPEVVANYVKNNDFSLLSPIYHALMVTYNDDVEKYAKNNSRLIRHCLETAPLEAGSRIKFEGFGKSNYKSREMGEALRTLEQAMLIYLCYPTTSVALPVAPDLKKSPRLQYIDTGLLNFKARLQEHYFSHATLHDFYRGLIAEHIVAQELICQAELNEKPLFWVREKKQSSAEVDFVVAYQGELFPVEVKAGKSGSLRSLHQFVEASSHKIAVRLYAGEFKKSVEMTSLGTKYTLLSVPYFQAARICDYLKRLK